MNILYIHTHDTGRYIQPYGYNIPTENLMKLAEEGTLFRNAYCVGPTCSPSRAGLVTGMSPHLCGMLGLAHRGFEMNDYSKHIGQFLHAYDYETVLCGIQHVAPVANLIGYDKILTVDDRDMGHGTEFDSEVWDKTNAQNVARYIKGKSDKPFFLSYGMFNTHRVFPEKAKGVNPNYVMPPFPLVDNKKTRKDTAGYITSAGIMDECVGIVLDALKESGKEEETIIIFTTDHGIAFPNMKCTLHDSGIGVALIIKYPENKMKGKVTDALVSHLDIFPTLCEMISVNKPEWLEGYSLLPIMNGEKEEIREELFSEVTYHAAYEPMRCIRTRRYKLIQFFDEHDQIVSSNIDSSFSKDFLLEKGYLNRPREKEMLYDLYLDPVEGNNLIESSEYKEIYQALSNRLHQWMEQTNDPLLLGKVQMPKDAKVNKLSCISAGEKNYE